MFEWAENAVPVDKAAYDNEVETLRMNLLDAQYDLLEKPAFPVLVLIAGVDGAGKGETVNLLTEWMDPRHIQTSAFAEPTAEEKQKPYFHRYWKALPPRGRIGIFFNSWYTGPILQRVAGRIKNPRFDQYLENINNLEQMLVRDGVLVIKLWFHLSKPAQKKRLNELHANPKTRWRVTDADWERFKLYDVFRRHAEHALARTSTPEAPWTVIDGEDPRGRALTVGRFLLAALRKRLDEPAPVFAPPGFTLLPDAGNPLRRLDYARALPKAEYADALETWQGRLNLLSRSKKFAKQAAVLVFEGMDAAGKGGAIRRITGALDARQYRVIPVAAPTAEERQYPYLWRFWRHLPARGQFAIFDRSWYGRVLVERVEGFAFEADWKRAYSEINAFEEQLDDAGITVIKFYLAVTPEKQLERFNERKTIGYKRFKITDEDWRNRDKWPLYEAAVNDMLSHTATRCAPWHLVEANDKYHARISILKTVAERLESGL